MTAGLNEIQLRLLDVLTKALSDKQADEFVYEWEWEMWFLPTQTIEILGSDIHTEYDLYFDFGEKDLNALSDAGYLQRIREERSENEQLIRITYRKI